jgi:uncharacterized protein (TIGR00730 family)
MLPDEREKVAALKRSPSYTRAYEDIQFLNQPELRPVRLQLELLKPEMIQNAMGVNSTIVVFGSARIPEPALAQRGLEKAERMAREAPDDPLLARKADLARRATANSRFYDEARNFSRIVSGTCQVKGHADFVVVTGGGPGIMEAANRGADDIGAISAGLNIILPMEQEPNPYITPELCFQFHYFAIRKMHFLLRAKALVVFPGGFGTWDELFETLTLIQTRKMRPIPIVLFGRAFWERAIDFAFLVEEGMISPEDRELFSFAETAEEAWRYIATHYEAQGELFAGRADSAPTPLSP